MPCNSAENEVAMPIIDATPPSHCPWWSLNTCPAEANPGFPFDALSVLIFIVGSDGNILPTKSSRLNNLHACYPLFVSTYINTLLHSYLDVTISAGWVLIRQSKLPHFSTSTPTSKLTQISPVSYLPSQWPSLFRFHLIQSRNGGEKKQLCAF